MQCLEIQGRKMFQRESSDYLSHSLIGEVQNELKDDHWCIGPRGDHSLDL